MWLSGCFNPNAAYIGGGASGGTLNNCMLTDNHAIEGDGGGASGGVLNIPMAMA